MKRFLEKILNFNELLNFAASRRPFAVLAMVVLSVSSLVTTFLGFAEYTEFRLVSVCASLGIQLLMLYAAVQIAALPSFNTSKALFLSLLFFVAMGISSFFSFAAFHDGIESEERRAEEGDTLLRSEWTRLYNGVREQIVREFDLRIGALAAGGADPYSQWRDELQEIVTLGTGFYATMLPLLNDRLADAEATQRRGQQDVNERRSEYERLDDSVARVQSRVRSIELEKAQLEAEIQALQEQYDNEVESGGTPLGEDRRSIPGEGPIARGLRDDRRDAEFRLRRVQQDLNLVQREFDTLSAQRQDELDRLRTSEEVIASGSQGPVQRFGAAVVLVQQFQRTIEGVKLPPDSISSRNAEAVSELGRVLRSSVGLCGTAKQQFNAALVAVSNAGISQQVIDSGRISNNSCDVHPAFANGETIANYISSFEQFIEQCNPIKLEQVETVNVGGASGLAPRQVYEENYRNLRDYFQRCLGLAPGFRSAPALESLMDGFRNLLLTYNPQAHPFTRAVAAFDRNDLPAILALVIALSIDGVILICGLALRDPLRNYDDISQ